MPGSSIPAGDSVRIRIPTRVRELATDKKVATINYDSIYNTIQPATNRLPGGDRIFRDQKGSPLRVSCSKATWRAPGRLAQGQDKQDEYEGYSKIGGYTG